VTITALLGGMSRLCAGCVLSPMVAGLASSAVLAGVVVLTARGTIEPLVGVALWVCTLVWVGAALMWAVVSAPEEGLQVEARKQAEI
jgi:hypothetical protein